MREKRILLSQCYQIHDNKTNQRRKHLTKFTSKKCQKRSQTRQTSVAYHVGLSKDLLLQGNIRLQRFTTRTEEKIHLVKIIIPRNMNINKPINNTDWLNFSVIVSIIPQVILPTTLYHWPGAFLTPFQGEISFEMM